MAMLTKAAIAVPATVIASAVAAFPMFAPAKIQGARLAQPIPNAFAAEPIAKKGDRLRVVAEPCTMVGFAAVCADIYGVSAGSGPTLTIERRIVDSTSVLIRIPLSLADAR